MDTERKELLERMDKSIARMRRKGYDPAVMVAKRNAVWDGGEYRIVDVTKYVIAAVGSEMPGINKNTKGKKINRRQRFALGKTVAEWEREVECGLLNPEAEARRKKKEAEWQEELALRERTKTVTIRL